MHLKSLILRGFKTFADKITFEFGESGITAIVGPNGCGKSNTVDAFRFVLGEGSFNELRVKNLPDVIFAGTEVRKPLSMSEVALIFDNADQKLPIEFSEVSIRRRTFRDGESEFLINNNSSRLKDIRDLFLDSGISEDSLSIIGQGKVDAILSSQPEERRGIFEEVAGIKKYKNRKIEAEKKLILAEQNLLRINDLKNEIGEKLNILEVQARAAQEYTDLKDELKKCELGLFKKQITALLEKNQALKKEIEEFEKSEEERKKISKIIEAEKHNLRENLRNLEGSLESAFFELESIKEKIETERSSMVIEQQRRLFEEKNKLRDILGEERFIQFEINQSGKQLTALSQKIADLKSRTEKAGREDLNILPELSDILNGAEKLLSISKQIIYSIHNKKLDNHALDNKVAEIFTKELQEAEYQRRIQEETISHKGEELDQIKARIEAASQNIAQLEEKEKDSASRQSLEFLTLQEEHAKLQDKISSQKKEKEILSLRLGFLEEKGEEPEIAALREVYFKNKLLLAKSEGELAQIEERVYSEYNLTLNELLAVSLEVCNLSSSKKQIAELRSRLFELEPVNLLAIEEFKQSKERFVLINEQHNDLSGARENLKRLIEELDAKAREVFLQKIEIITSHFKAIFSELFEGGEAKLELSYNESKDPLEAGIEISTCPSGRKWLPLQALSGGERALTAIAILFAFLRTNPSPICMLDEVDAPLDDANIGRFIKYLKEISASTQILIITHNKYTMKAADTIYGITMEEPGVSKVISMRMDKFAEEPAAV